MIPTCLYIDDEPESEREGAIIQIIQSVVELGQGTWALGYLTLKYPFTYTTVSLHELGVLREKV